MHFVTRFLLGALALMMIGSAPASARPVDWTTTVSLTPEGGYLVGNPEAKVKVIEYFSLTCSHCRHFAETGMPSLKKNYVAWGKVSVELRNFVLNPADMAASVLMRCAIPAKSVRLFDAAYAEQDTLFAGAYQITREAAQQIMAAPLAQRTDAYARATGIDRWFVAKGLKPASVAQCLADPARQERLVQLRDAGVKLGVEGTPTFFVNGRKVDGTGWAELEAALKAAL